MGSQALYEMFHAMMGGIIGGATFEAVNNAWHRDDSRPYIIVVVVFMLFLWFILLNAKRRSTIRA